MIRLSSLTIAALILFIQLGWVAGPARGQIPQKFGYQGLLNNSAGIPINGTVSMVFRLYSTAPGGSSLYAETQSVSVSNGSFNVLIGSVTALTLPFDVQYYLGITVGTDPEMTPRQPLAAAPYAIRAATTQALATNAPVPGVQITGSITSGTLPAGNVTGTLATAQLASNSVTQSKLSPLTGAAAGKVLGTDGTNLQWQTPAAGGAGSVSSVTATAQGGLATTPAGGISTTGSIGIAPSGIQTAMIADGAVTPAKLAATQQLPSCVVGQIARWTGSGWACGNLPPSISVIELQSMASGSTSLVLPADGIPVIAYASTGGARVVKCANAACTGVATSMLFKQIGADSVSIAIGPDGFPLVAFYVGGATTDLYFAKCSSPTCAADSQYFAVDADQRGMFVSLAVAADGLPIMAYFDGSATGKIPRIGHCANSICNPGGPISIPLDSTNLNQGKYTSLAIGADGFAVVSYRDEQNSSLKVAKCSNVACTSGATLTTVDNAADVGEHTSIKIGTDGNPVIAYYDRSNGNLKVAKCANALCTGSASISTVDNSLADVGTHTSIAIGNDGFPVIAYRDETNVSLKIAKCINAACTGTSLITVLDNGANVGQYTSIAVQSDGMPIVSYFDKTNNALRVAKCSNVACLRP